MFKTSLKLFLAVTLTLGLSMSFQSLLATWDPPSAPPPTPNVPEPINAGFGSQTKNGYLYLLNGLGVSGGLAVHNDSGGVILDLEGHDGTRAHGLDVINTTSQGNIQIAGVSDSGSTFSALYLNDSTIDLNNTWVLAHKNAASTIQQNDFIIARYNSPTNSRTDFVIDSSTGNIGIGGILNPSQKLDVNGSINLSGGGRSVLANSGTASFGSTNSHTYIRSATSRNIYLQTGTSNRLTVLGNGRVGINTVSPTQSLDVNGKIRMRSQTVSTDSDDTVVTKGYADSLVTSISPQVHYYTASFPGGSGGNCSNKCFTGVDPAAGNWTMKIRWYDHAWFEQNYTGVKASGVTSVCQYHCIHQGGSGELWLTTGGSGGGAEVIDGTPCTNSANGWGVSCVSYCPTGYLAIGAQCRNTHSWGATIQKFQRVSTNGWQCELHRIKNDGGMSMWNQAICLKL